jgi:hypothetical protein
MEVGNGIQGVYDPNIEEFHPFIERHFPQWGCGELVALTDIYPGDELFDNYLVFGGVEEWDHNLQELKLLCSGTAVGIVSTYEQHGIRTN